jgi:hypothetical protein
MVPVVAFLRRGAALSTVVGMSSTLTKARTTKPACVGKTFPTRAGAIAPDRDLPPAKGTAADLLKDVKAGEFLKGANMDRIETAHKSRSSRRLGAAK